MKVQLPTGGIVERRYRHFLWLKDALLKQAPGTILPPFPRETGTDASRGLDNSSDAFVQKRMAALALFLNRVLARDDWRDSAALSVFCTAPFDDFGKLSAVVNAAEAQQAAEADALAVDAARANGDIGSPTAAAASCDGATNNWSRYGEGTAMEGGAQAASPAPAETTGGWFASLSSHLPASLPSSLTALASSVARSATAAGEPAVERTPADQKMVALLAHVHEAEAAALASFQAMHGLTNARIEACSEAVRWAHAAVRGMRAPWPDGDGGGGQGDQGGRANATTVAGESPSPSAAETACSAAHGGTGVPLGCAPGLSGRLAYFGEARQRAVVAAAKSEHAVFAKALGGRLGTLAAAKDALASRDGVRQLLASARQALAATQASLAEARTKEAAAVARDRGPTAAGTTATPFTQERQASEVARVKAAAQVERLKHMLALADRRVAHGWAEASEAWAASVKATLLEAVRPSPPRARAANVLRVLANARALPTISTRQNQTILCASTRVRFAQKRRACLPKPTPPLRALAHSSAGPLGVRQPPPVPNANRRPPIAAREPRSRSRNRKGRRRGSGGC
jgi:hypothetical protein